LIKGKLQIVIFTIFLVVMAVLFRYCSGPFYFGNNSDPSYLYLYNFLYVFEGKSPTFVDHPGTTLDVLGALVVKIFFAPQPNTPWLLTYASRTEEVLGMVWLFMIVMYAATLVILGLYVFKKSRDRVFTGLVLLSSLWVVMIRSFASQGILPISANVNSDTMMMTADNLMLLAILRYYFSSKTEIYLQAICLGGAVAFAVATKFTALPFFVVAFCILASWQQRVLLGIVTVGGFILLTYPIWGSYPKMITWIESLILYRGMHGGGGEGFDGVKYLHSFFWVIKNYYLFVVGWFLAGAIAVGVPKPRADPKIRRILLGVALGGLAQVILVAKQPSYQYMAPMIGLSSLGLAFLYKAFPDWWRRGLKYVVAAILMVSLWMMALSMWQVNEKMLKTKAMLDTIKKDYSQCLVCPFYRSSLPGFGLVFWNNLLHRDDYGSILKKYYPDMAYYDTFAKDFKDSARQIVSLEQLRQQRSRVLIYGTDQDPKSFGEYLTVNKIYTNGGPEALYEVVSARSNLGVQYFQYALILDAQGRDEDALKAAVISQRLGVGQDISGFIEFLRKKIR